MRAALRRRWPSPSGRCDHAPKQAHGGWRPSTSWRAIATLNATSSGLTGVTTGPFTVNPAAATHLTVLVQPPANVTVVY